MFLQGIHRAIFHLLQRFNTLGLKVKPVSRVDSKSAFGGFIKSRLPQFKSTSCFSGLKRFVQLSRLHRCAKAASCRQPGILLAYHIAKHAELAVVKAIHREDIGQQRTFYTSLLLQIQETIISRQFVHHRA